MSDQSNKIAELERRIKELEVIKTPMIKNSTSETLRSVVNALEFLTHAELNAEDNPNDARHVYVHSMTRDILLWSAISAVEYERNCINRDEVRL